MSVVRDISRIDEQIEKLKGGQSLTENEVKILCDEVRLNIFNVGLDTTHYVFRWICLCS